MQYLEEIEREARDLYLSIPTVARLAVPALVNDGANLIGRITALREKLGVSDGRKK